MAKCRGGGVSTEKETITFDLYATSVIAMYQLDTTHPLESQPRVENFEFWARQGDKNGF